MWNNLLCVNVLILFWTHSLCERASSHRIDLERMKQRWDECCEANFCIQNSCYIIDRRASTWGAVRQRCQNIFRNWPSAVDLFQIRNREDVEILNELLLESSQNSKDDKSVLTVWTSGTRCTTADKKKYKSILRWTSGEQFAVWLEDEIEEDIEDDSENRKVLKRGGCQFLVLVPASNITNVRYKFEDQQARHSALCEFQYAGELETTTFTMNDINTTKSIYHSTLRVKSETLQSASDLKSTEVSSTIYPANKETPTTTIPTAFCRGRNVFGINWPNTTPGSTINTSCPVGMIGYAQWTCDELTLEFTPEKPHIQDCKHAWISELEENVDDGGDAIVISHKLAEKTKKQEMSHGDITALVNLSTKLYNLYQMQVDEETITTVEEEEKLLSYSFTGSMVASMSNILRAEAKNAWEILPEIHQTRAASKILKLVTDVGS